MKGFRLKRMKGFLDSGDIELRPLTIMIGQNSSGKSSLLRFPLVVKQTILDDSNEPLLFSGDSIDYGNYQDVVFHHQLEQPMELELDVNSTELKQFFPEQTLLDDLQKEMNFLDNLQTLRLRLLLSENNGTTRLDQLDIQNVESDTCILSVRRICEKPEDGEEDFWVKYYSDSDLIIMDLNDSVIDEITETFLLHHHAFPVMRTAFENSDVSTNFSERFNFSEHLFTALSRYFKNFASSIHYIGPFRAAPERYYRYKGRSANHVGGVGEFAPLILGQDQRNGGTLLQTVSGWLQEHLGFSLEIEEMQANGTSELFKLMIQDHVTKARNNLMDVGHGLPQLIPIIVDTFLSAHANGFKGFSNNNSKLHIIEQPEIHLHPAAQASLADLFLAGIQNGTSNHKFLIETHSEHMLIRLRRYVAEGKLSPDDIAIYYTEKQESDGSIQVQRLRIEPDGQMESWPEGFFEEDYRESLALRKAMRSKRNQSEV